MSDGFKPFGRSDRTIILPNPGGRRREPPQPTPQAAPAEEWIADSPPRPVQAVPTPAAPKRQLPTTPNENPVMGAAGPLLLLLGSLRISLLRAPSSQLMEQVADAIQDFERDIRAAGISAEQARVAKYAVCATADDIVQNIPRDDRHVWTQYSMLSRFFGERIGGVRFFEELDRAKLDPTANYPLLELMHACLALGFEGIHRTSSGGIATLQQIQRNLYETLRRVRGANRELSPHWQGQWLPTHLARFRVPVWAVAACAGVLLLALYLTLRALLGGGAETVAAETLAMHPTADIAIQRRVFAPPPPPPPPSPQPTQLSRIRGALRPEIADNKLTVQQTGNQIIIRVANLALFAPGDATVREDFRPIAARIAAVLEKEPGVIKVVGHTDSDPIHTIRFPSNWQLSLARARAVAALLRRGLSQPDRIETDGKGADVPIASNETPEGRAQNRRVEILIPRSD